MHLVLCFGKALAWRRRDTSRNLLRANICVGIRVANGMYQVSGWVQEKVQVQKDKIGAAVYVAPPFIHELVLVVTGSLFCIGLSIAPRYI